MEDADSIEVSVTAAEIPAFPASLAGQIAVVTSHRETHYVLDVVWDVWAGRCSESDVVQLIAKADGYGIALVFASAPADSGSVTLPILTPNDSTLPDTSAQVALQIYPEDRSYVLKGVDGTFEVDNLAEFITGRFSGRLVETTYRDTVFLAGSFTSVPTEVVGDEYCLATNGPSSSIPDDGLEPKPVPGGQVDDNG